MRKLFTSLTILLVIILSACVSGENPTGTEAPQTTTTVPFSNNAIITKDDFEVKLFADKTTYAANEPINIWANFKYVGNQEEIRIGHAMDYMGFDIIQVDGSLEFRGVMPLPYTTSIIKKGVDYRKDYVKSGGYSNNDPNAETYKKFFEGKEVLLPPGTYKVASTAHFDLADLQNNPSKEFKTILVEIFIKVTK